MKTLIIISFMLNGVTLYACNCIDSISIKNEFDASDLVVTGVIYDKKEIKIWSDTSLAQYYYKKSNSTLSYEQFKYDNDAFGIKLMEYQFIVEKVYKGKLKNDTLRIRTGFGIGDCGVVFKDNISYLLFANDESSIVYSEPKLNRKKCDLKNIYRTNSCTRTKELRNVNQDVLTILNELSSK